jgi:WhiB family redox-sensing transcriptional regulator
MLNPMHDVWEWQFDAACRGMDSSLFFHPWGERGPARDVRVGRAKAVCAGCLVSAACRQHALRVQEPYGVWGGLSEEERLVLLGRQRRPRAAQPLGDGDGPG